MMNLNLFQLEIYRQIILHKLTAEDSEKQIREVADEIAAVIREKKCQH